MNPTLRRTIFPLTLFLLAAPLMAKDRWPVKTGMDPEASRVNTQPVAVGIDTMNSWNGGGPYSWAYLKKMEKKRIAPHELQVYHVEGMLTWFQCACDPKRGDQDYLLVLESESGKSIIAKIPSPQRVDPKSPFYAQIQQTRAVMEKVVEAGPQKQKIMRKVAVEGPAFFDKAHGQLGRAENSVEIHPVLKLTWLEP